MTTVEYTTNVLSKDLYDRTLEWLKKLSFYNGCTNKGIEIDRKQIWYHTSGKYFNHLWTDRYDRWVGNLFPVILFEIMNELGINCNSCLINYYVDGKSFIPKHIDSITSFGTEPIIVNLSIGASRTLKVDTKDYILENNSKFVMSGPSVPHELLKDPNCKSPRWSLTFRNHIA